MEYKVIIFYRKINMGKKLTRRNFLRYDAAAAAVPVLSMFAQHAYAEETSIVFSEEYDVIVVGSGIAGTTAAIRADRKSVV